ncbi:Nephrin [Lonchura striata]|uniref:Nephrin n=1 Tax=Lonchura striata TaxID=40157 RepID=A0A218U736_9PASE|nr:Nephrin [Lonchura striata domestica]
MVARMVAHPGYDPSTKDNDIMLLKLLAPAAISERVRPVPVASCLPRPGTACVTSGWGATTSPEGSAPPAPAPPFLEEPANGSAVLGEGAELRCRVRVGVAVQWARAGLLLGAPPTRAHPRYRLAGDPEKGEHHLRIRPVALEDDGAFSCQAGQGNGTRGSRPALLSDGEPLEGAWSEDEGGVARTRLVFSPAPEDDGATLRCRAVTSLPGGGASASVKLRVSYPPAELTLQGSGAVAEGGEARLSCTSAPSNPPVRLRWWLGGTELRPSAEGPAPGGGTVSNVTLRGRGQDHGSALVCEAETPGVGTRSVAVTVSVSLRTSTDQLGTSTDQYRPVRDQYGPVRDQYGTVRDQYGPVRDQYGPRPVRDQYGPIWTSTEYYGPVWTSINQYGTVRDQLETSTDQYGPVQNIMDQYEPYRPVRDQYGPIWTSIEHYGPVWTSIDQLETSTDQYGPNTMDQYRSVRTSTDQYRPVRDQYGPMFTSMDQYGPV